jgi:hypothetical protein
VPAGQHEGMAGEDRSGVEEGDDLAFLQDHVGGAVSRHDGVEYALGRRGHNPPSVARRCKP